jgi:hypothetical protein
MLGLTFIAIVISDLAECRPFNHYWQVLPDPGGHCRQGYVNLLTTGVCNILTDLLLVLFPVPIIINSSMSVKRKAQLVLLFSLSLSVVAVTFFRVTHVIGAHGSQQMRSLLASAELLVATGVANALVLGSFVRDRGVKKRKFRYDSVAGESYHGTDSANRSRRPAIAGQAWGSDVDLVRDVGFGVRNELRGLEADPEAGRPTPAGPVAPHKDFNLQNWNFPERSTEARRGSQLLPSDQLSDAPSSSGPRRVSFFDVGGLLDDDSPSSPSTARRQSTISSRDPLSPYKPNPHRLSYCLRARVGFGEARKPCCKILGASYLSSLAKVRVQSPGVRKEKDLFLPGLSSKNCHRQSLHAQRCAQLTRRHMKTKAGPATRII